MSLLFQSAQLIFFSARFISPENNYPRHRKCWWQALYYARRSRLIANLCIVYLLLLYLRLSQAQQSEADKYLQKARRWAKRGIPLAEKLVHQGIVIPTDTPLMQLPVGTDLIEMFRALDAQCQALISVEGDKNAKDDLTKDSVQEIDLDSQNALSCYQIGSVYWKEENFVAAYAAFKRATELDPNYADAYEGMGVACRNLGLYEEAFAAYDRAIELDPKNADYRDKKGYAYYMHKNYEKAVEIWNEVLNLTPSSADTYLYLGFSYKFLKRYKDSIAATRKAIEFSPDSADSYRNGLGCVLLLQGLVSEAKAEFEKAHAFEPLNCHPLFNLGIVSVLEGDLDNARTYWRDGLSLHTDDEPYAQLNQALWKMVSGNTLVGLQETQSILDQQGELSKMDIEGVLEDVRIMLRAPIEIDGLSKLSEMLRQALDNFV